MSTYVIGDIGIVALTKGHFALIDKEDVDKIAKYKWHYSEGHAPRAKPHRNKTIVMSRLILDVSNNKILVDHKNRNVLDNRRCNLRFADKSTNAMNTKRRNDNTSGFKGVSFNVQKKKWEAYLNIGGKRKRLGLHYFKIDAIIARKNAEAKYFKEFRSCQEHLY